MLKTVPCLARAGAHRGGQQLRRYHVTGFPLEPSLSSQGIERARKESYPSQERTASRPPTDIQQLTLVCNPDVNKRSVWRSVESGFLGLGRKVFSPGLNCSAVVILATPKFVTWLEDYEVFIPSVLRRIVRSTHQGPLELDVICACVDGLSPQTEDILRASDQTPKEGFSIFYDIQYRHLVNPWSKISATETNIAPKALSSLLFSQNKNKFDITVPLANTLFKNSKLSTLLASKWKQGDDGKFSIVRGPVEKQQVAINFNRQVKSHMPELYTHALPLTTPREIEHGLGNIVRAIRFDSGPGPASHELEEAVNKYMKKSQQGPIDVWALIIPKDVVSVSDSALGEPLLAESRCSLECHWDPWSVPDDSYISNWIAKGARFCRVLSGGGGWGIKQGLLSLDPQTHYNDLTEARFDFSDETVESQRASALGNIAQAGSFIQFFFTKKRETPQNEIRSPPCHTEGIVSSRKCTVIGTAPSTADEFPSSKSILTNDTKYSKMPIRILKGHFGCLTESGLFLNREAYKISIHDRQEVTIPACTTKVDMPHSYFYKDWRKEDQRAILRWETGDHQFLRRIRGFGDKYFHDQELRINAGAKG